MKDSAVREILFSYQQKRDKAEYEFEERKKKIYNRFPEIQKIDDDITNVGLRMMRIVISNSPDKEIQLNQYKDKLNALKLSKNNLLKMHNIPKNALEIQYECPLCEDTGFLKSGEKCNCFKQALINEYYKMSNISKNFKTQNFNTLDLSLFSDEIIPELNISSKQNILEISAICEMFVQNFTKENEENLLFYGDTGLGKTFMSNCIAKALLDKGFTVIYQTSFKMFEIIEEYKFHNINNSISKENYNNLFECDLLIIDDLGTELTNTFTVSELFMILITLVKFVGKDLRWESKFD